MIDVERAWYLEANDAEGGDLRLFGRFDGDGDRVTALHRFDLLRVEHRQPLQRRRRCLRAEHWSCERERSEGGGAGDVHSTPVTACGTYGSSRNSISSAVRFTLSDATASSR